MAHKDVSDELREVCKHTVDELTSRQGMPYADNLSFDAEHQYLIVEPASLTVHELVSRRGQPDSSPASTTIVELDSAALEVLENASSLPALENSDLKDSFLFYAAVVGNTVDDRTAFVCQWNPYKSAFRGKLLTWFGDGLRRVEGPVLTFESNVHMVVRNRRVAVLNAKAFEKIFRDIDSMRDRVPIWGQAVTDLLSLDESSSQVLQEVCRKNLRVAAQARSLFERSTSGKKLSANDLKAEMQKLKLDIDRFMPDGQLVVTEDNIVILLKLADEKLYTGWHSETPWDVGTRAKRQS